MLFSDFGIVVIEHVEERIVNVTNYGFAPAFLYTSGMSDMREMGFFFRGKTRNEIKQGKAISFSILFAPKKHKYTSRILNVKSAFHFEVNITLKAKVSTVI